MAVKDYSTLADKLNKGQALTAEEKERLQIYARQGTPEQRETITAALQANAALEPKPLQEGYAEQRVSVRAGGEPAPAFRGGSGGLLPRYTKEENLEIKKSTSERLANNLTQRFNTTPNPFFVVPTKPTTTFEAEAIASGGKIQTAFGEVKVLPDPVLRAAAKIEEGRALKNQKNEAIKYLERERPTMEFYEQATSKKAEGYQQLINTGISKGYVLETTEGLVFTQTAPKEYIGEVGSYEKNFKDLVNTYETKAEGYNKKVDIANKEVKYYDIPSFLGSKAREGLAPTIPTTLEGIKKLKENKGVSLIDPFIQKYPKVVAFTERTAVRINRGVTDFLVGPIEHPYLTAGTFAGGVVAPEILPYVSKVSTKLAGAIAGSKTVGEQVTKYGGKTVGIALAGTYAANTGYEAYMAERFELGAGFGVIGRKLSTEVLPFAGGGLTYREYQKLRQPTEMLGNIRESARIKEYKIAIREGDTVIGRGLGRMETFSKPISSTKASAKISKQLDLTKETAKIQQYISGQKVRGLVVKRSTIDIGGKEFKFSEVTVVQKGNQFKSIIRIRGNGVDVVKFAGIKGYEGSTIKLPKSYVAQGKGFSLEFYKGKYKFVTAKAEIVKLGSRGSYNPARPRVEALIEQQRFIPRAMSEKQINRFNIESINFKAIKSLSKGSFFKEYIKTGFAPEKYSYAEGKIFSIRHGGNTIFTRSSRGDLYFRSLSSTEAKLTESELTGIFGRAKGVTYSNQPSSRFSIKFNKAFINQLSGFGKKGTLGGSEQQSIQMPIIKEQATINQPFQQQVPKPIYNTIQSTFPQTLIQVPTPKLLFTPPILKFGATKAPTIQELSITPRQISTVKQVNIQIPFTPLPPQPTRTTTINKITTLQLTPIIPQVTEVTQLTQIQTISDFGGFKGYPAIPGGVSSGGGFGFFGYGRRKKRNQYYIGNLVGLYTGARTPRSKAFGIFTGFEARGRIV